MGIGETMRLLTTKAVGISIGKGGGICFGGTLGLKYSESAETTGYGGGTADVAIAVWKAGGRPPTLFGPGD